MEFSQFFGGLDRLTEPLEALLGGDALCRQPLGLTSLLEQRPAFREIGVGCRAALPRSGQRVAVALQLGQGELTLFDGGRLPERPPPRRP